MAMTSSSDDTVICEQCIDGDQGCEQCGLYGECNENATCPFGAANIIAPAAAR